MKTSTRLLFLLTLPSLFLSCKDKIEETYTVNEPVYMTYSDLHNSFKVADGQEIVHPGKIYFKDNFIFVNEYQKGIHIVNNTDPASPQVVKFIEIPGNVDIAIRENILYADSYVDLVAIDISDINNIREVKRIENVFPYMIPECENGVVENVDINKGVVVGWNATERKVDVESQSQYNQYPVWRDNFSFLASYDAKNGGASAESTTGTGGSMARFMVYDEYLYAVDNYSLRLFTIAVPENPSVVKEIYVGWNIETLFPYENKLFMGSTTGLYIYSLENPSEPQFISQLRHASSCDPVVVNGDYAYVTLRSGDLCGNALSQLDVIDIRDLSQPSLLKEYTMEEPYGLGIDGNLLFVCDGKAGLKIFDVTDPNSIDEHLIVQYKDIQAFDVIPLGEVLIMIGTDGLYQYDYSDPNNVHELSMIPIGSLQHGDN